MSDGLFPGFETRRIDVGRGEIAVRVGGSGPPLLLLHGYPQTHAMWHRVAPALAADFTCVLPDLPGYGESFVPDAAADHAPMSKRLTARDMVAAMRELGFSRFRLAGHDRGGRVAYRLALDLPEAVERLAVLDIVPTAEMWAGMDAALAYTVYHWTFLAQPAPLPERMIGSDPDAYLDWTIASWTAAKDLSAFDDRALDHYRACFRQTPRIAAACEDYRAGFTRDREADEADLAAGRKIVAPLLALWGEAGIPSEGAPPLDIWRAWAEDVRGDGIAGGHFLCEEAPADTTQALRQFFTS